MVSITPDIIQILIQGGAVGVLLAFGYGIYKLARRLIDAGSILVSNHLAHLTNTLENVNTTLARLDGTIQGCPARAKLPQKSRDDPLN